MAKVVVTLKIMPEAPDTDLESIETSVRDKVSDFGGDVGKVEQVPVAFGLKSLNVLFIMDEDKGSTDELEKQVAQIDGVNSVDVIDVRRTIG